MRRVIAMIVAAGFLMGAAACSSIPTGFPGLLPKPDRPDVSNKTPVVGEKVTFETEGTDPFNVHEWRWVFGDGTAEDWDDDAEKIKHRFMAVGEFQVIVQEQCPLLKDALRSDWSDPRKVTVLPAPVPVGFLDRLLYRLGL